MTLDELLRRGRLWRAGEAAAGEGIATGFPALDALLPGGGWPFPGLVEILASHLGLGGLRLLLPALAALARAGRWLIWVAPPHLPYAPALQAAGLELARVLVVDLGERGEAAARLPASPATCLGWRQPAEGELWAYEQALRFGHCGAALLWATRLEALVLRRLQLACEAGGSLGFLFRPAEYASQSSPAALRLVLEPRDVPGGLRIRILKCRGGARDLECDIALHATAQA